MCGGRAADGTIGGCLASGDVRDRETLLKKATCKHRDFRGSKVLKSGSSFVLFWLQVDTGVSSSLGEPRPYAFTPCPHVKEDISITGNEVVYRTHLGRPSQSGAR